MHEQINQTKPNQTVDFTGISAGTARYKLNSSSHKLKLESASIKAFGTKYAPNQGHAKNVKNTSSPQKLTPIPNGTKQKSQHISSVTYCNRLYSFGSHKMSSWTFSGYKLWYTMNSSTVLTSGYL